MIIDTLTIAGLFSAASYLLMPLLMGREFIRVETRDDTETRPLRLKTTAGRAPQSTRLGLN